ncbi:MAG TPA: tyrosine-type recombinase/integrase [Pyrinomonadaceae bacterium]
MGEFPLALRNAVRLWADSSTVPDSARREDLLRDKQRAVTAFFLFANKHPGEVIPQDVKNWQKRLEAGGLSPSTVYVRVSFLSSFYEWLMRDPELGGRIGKNPVSQARPRAPKPYQTESVKALTDEELERLLETVGRKAAAGDVVGKRDYALLLLFVATGMRRAELLSLRGRDLRLDDGLILTSRVKGGNYAGREVAEPRVREALLDYLTAAGRLAVLKTDGPVWTRHDNAGRPGAQLSSHAYVKNLKRYAREAGVEGFHLHRTRHTFARIVAEDSGSITETQDALGHRNAATTRVYVQRIAVKRDKHSERILGRFAKK